jgi:hypothetical protein
MSTFGTYVYSWHKNADDEKKMNTLRMSEWGKALETKLKGVADPKKLFEGKDNERTRQSFHHDLAIIVCQLYLEREKIKEKKDKIRSKYPVLYKQYHKLAVQWLHSQLKVLAKKSKKDKDKDDHDADKTGDDNNVDNGDNDDNKNENGGNDDENGDNDDNKNEKGGNGDKTDNGDNKNENGDKTDNGDDKDENSLKRKTKEQLQPVVIKKGALAADAATLSSSGKQGAKILSAPGSLVDTALKAAQDAIPHAGVNVCACCIKNCNNNNHVHTLCKECGPKGTSTTAKAKLKAAAAAKSKAKAAAPAKKKGKGLDLGDEMSDGDDDDEVQIVNNDSDNDSDRDPLGKNRPAQTRPRMRLAPPSQESTVVGKKKGGKGGKKKVNKKK